MSEIEAPCVVDSAHTLNNIVPKLLFGLVIWAHKVAIHPQSAVERLNLIVSVLHRL